MPSRLPSPRASARSASTACALLTVTLLTTGCATTIEGEAVAGVTTSQIRPAIDTDTVTLRHDYETSAQEVNDYWTAERIEDAVPREIDPGEVSDTFDAPPDSATGVIIDPTTGSVRTDEPQLVDSLNGAPFDATGLTASTQGRLYMATTAGDSVCSASVVNSASGSVIATAAHCVWDFDADTWTSNMWFVPADANNAAVAPYGVWNAVSVVASQKFTDHATVTTEGGLAGSGWAYDFAFLEMGRNAQGQTIQEVTGAQGIAFGMPAEELVVIGYPTAPPFDGTSQRYCSASTWAPYRGAYSIPCGMTAGSSGGGWLTNYDPVSGSGYLVATTSFRNANRLGAVPLGSVALQIFTEIGGR